MAVDPVSLLLGVPVLGPVLAWALYELRSMRLAHEGMMQDLVERGNESRERMIKALEALTGELKVLQEQHRRGPRHR